MRTVRIPRLITLLALAQLSLGCGGQSSSTAPSESEAEAAVRAMVEQDSGGRMRVVTYQKTDGQSNEAFGIHGYTLYYTVEVEVIQPCFMDVPFIAHAPERFGGTNMNPGDRFKSTGKVGFERRESGWKRLSTNKASIDGDIARAPLQNSGDEAAATSATGRPGSDVRAMISGTWRDEQDGIHVFTPHGAYTWQGNFLKWSLKGDVMIVEGPTGPIEVRFAFDGRDRMRLNVNGRETSLVRTSGAEADPQAVPSAVWSKDHWAKWNRERAEQLRAIGQALLAHQNNSPKGPIEHVADLVLRGDLDATMAFLPRTSGVKQRFQAVAKTDWQKTPQGKAAMREAIIAEADYVFVGKGMNFSPETVAAYERRPPMTNRVLLLFGDGHVEETDKADPRYTALQK